jgi:hypothetical protein
MSLQKPTGAFLPVPGFESQKFELIAELPPLPDGDGQSVSVVLSRNVDTGACWGSLEYEQRGRTEDVATFNVSTAHFWQLTGAQPLPDSLEAIVQTFARLDPHDLATTQRLQHRARTLLATR